MTDKEFATSQRRIKALLKKYRSIGMGWWNLTVSYARHPADMPETYTPSNGQWDCAASTRAAWEYRLASITFNMPAVLHADDEELEAWFLHEYAHCLVNQMRSIVKTEEAKVENWIQHEEAVCVSIAKAIQWAYLAGVNA